jgi:hypothetical protein
MLRGKLLRQALDKFLKKSEVAKEARVQVCLPNGELYDVIGIELMENKLIGKKSLGPLSIKLYEGSSIMKLVNHEPCACVAEGWTKVQEHLVNVT